MKKSLQLFLVAIPELSDAALLGSGFHAALSTRACQDVGTIDANQQALAGDGFVAGRGLL